MKEKEEEERGGGERRRRDKWGKSTLDPGATS
jgi:hypothetical protein